jgi:hypothetical protein
MTDFDFNEAEPQRAGGGELIPDNTVALVVAKLRPGGSGPDGWLKPSQTGCEMLDFEFTVDGGDYDRRKLWGLYVVSGCTDGHEKAANISRSHLRAMLESARSVNPDDTSAEAIAARRANGYADFDGISFCAKIGIEPGGLKDKTAGPNSERYADKNVIKSVVTPDQEDYIKPGGGAPRGASKPVNQNKPAGGQPASGGSAKPSWAA